MKKYISFSMVLLLISCTVDEISENEITTVNSVSHQEIQQSSPISESNKKSVVNDIEVFRQQMEWTAFITAEILAEATNPTIITEMDIAIATYGTVIPVDALLGDQSNYPVFKMAFKNKFLEYYIATCRPNFGTQRPPNNGLVSDNPPPPAAPSSNSYQSWAESFATQFIDKITNRNCIELYIPNGIEYGGANIPILLGNDHYFDIPTYLIGAHPLTNQTSNGPGWRIYPGKPKITLCRSYIPSISVIVSSLEVSFGNVIIARPYRDTAAGCNYTSIDVTDFTLYLD